MAVDMRGCIIKLGDTVARGKTLNQAGSAGIELCKVTEVIEGKVYLDGSNRPIKIPERLLVVQF